jgi:Skp family chaperone for outer membrane proteins
MVIMVRFLLVLLFAQVSFGSAESIDSECRIQAKETAITTYQSCVKESRTQKIEEIRKEYQSKLQELKSYYDGEMKKMSTAQKSQLDEKQSELTMVMKKKGKGSAKSNAVSNGLPAKKMSGKSLPVRNTPTINAQDSSTIQSSQAVEGSDAAEIVNIEDGSI